MLRPLLAAAVVAFILIGSGCTDLTARMRRYTYPPNFTYITEEQLRSTMWRLAEQIRWLDAVLRDDSRVEPDRQQTVLDLLDEIDAMASEIDGSGVGTNHPLLDAHLPRFRDDLALARSAAASDPPYYALAGEVAGACVYCHESRAGGVTR
jgi:hypothetical protein